MSKLQSFLISLLISLFATTIVFAWNSPTSAPPSSAGEAMYVDSSGNVGIGTATPSRQLEVASTTAPAIAIQEGAKEWRIGVESSKFKIMETGVSDRFTIDTAGNIGIGTTTPITRFHVESSTTGGGGGTVFLDDGFEDGTIDPFTSVGTNNIYWDVTSADKFAGAYSAKSGTLIDNQNTVIKITKTLTNSGTISFARKVSSETNYDKLYFFIDGVSQNYWSGEVAWSTVSYSVSAGTHEFSWTYIKDGSVSSGSDAAWIDSVEIIGNEVVSMASYFNNSGGGSAIQTGAGNVLISDSVGIGTTTPSTKLEVLGNADSILKLSRSSATSTTFRVGLDGALVIQNQATDALIIKNGNVGIGTTGPGSILHTYKGGSGASIYSTAYSVLAVENNNHAMIDFLTPNNKQGGLYFNDPEQAAMAEFVYSHANDYFHFGVRPGVGQGMITAMVIKNNGNIGIATTTPVYPLAVAGTIYSSTGGFRFPDGTTQATAATAGWTLSGSNLYTSSTSYNVGIGTSTPITQLHIPGRIPSSAVGSITTGSNPIFVYVQGRYAYVLNTNTLQIFDVSNPASPVSVGSIATGLGPSSVYVQGRYAYVLNYSGDTLQIFDVSNPASPVSVGSIAASWGPSSVYVQGRYAYVTIYGGSKLQIFDVSNPASPVSVGSIAASWGPSSVYVQGRYAYVTLNTGTLQIFDVSNPASPVSVGSIATGLAPSSVYVQGRYAYVLNGSSNTLQIFDVSNPASPVSVGSITTGTNPISVYVQGRYAYVTNYGGSKLQIFDVSNPASPVSVGSIDTGLAPSSVYVQGRYAYVTNSVSNTFQIFDVGGAYIQQFEAGGIETGTLATRSNLQVGNDLDVRGGLNVGRGIYTTGPFSVYGGSSGSTFVIDQNGKVGIGTTSPGAKLEINAYGVGNALKLQGNSADPNYYTQFYQSYGAGGLIITNKEYSQPDTIVTLKQGNVGIGTTDPTTKLQVADGSISIKETGISQAAMSYGTGKFTLGLDSAGTDGIYFRTYSGGYDDRVVIKAGGNVGIGTTSPGAKLEVSGGNINVRSTTGDAILKGFNVAGGDATLFLTGTANTANWKFNTFSTAGALFIQNDGNVGIGTTSPTALLHITQAGTTNYFLKLGDTQASVNRFVVDGSGNVGIGTTDPKQKLDVAGSISIGGGTETAANYILGGTGVTNSPFLQLFGSSHADSTRRGEFTAVSYGTGDIRFYNQPTASSWSALMKITASGNVGIGMEPLTKLAVSGLASYQAGRNICSDAGGNFYYYIGPCVPSSKKYKENILSLSLGLDSVMKLRPVTFDWKKNTASYDGRTHLGFIAEEAEEINPLLVEYDQEGLVNGVRYTEITSLLTKAIQDQQKQIEELKAEIETLKNN